MGKSTPSFGLSAQLEPRWSFHYLAVTIGLLFLSVSAAWAQVTIHIPADRPTIQAGIDAASNGDTVLVAPGTYSEAIDYKGKAITVQSSAGPASTIIDGTNHAFVVTFQTNETRSSILSGFTIQNGGMPEATFQPPFDRIWNPEGYGQSTGGVEVLYGSAPTITGNIITKNGCAGVSAGGTPLIQNNEISNTSMVSQDIYHPGHCGNDIVLGPEVSGTPGGSAVVLYSVTNQPAPSLPVVVIGNTIENNSVLMTSPASDSYGGAGIKAFLANSLGSAIIENNIVRNNSSSGWGGGALFTFFPGIVTQNLIYRNHAGCAGGGAIFGVIPFESSPFFGPTKTYIVNNLIADNSADYSGSCNTGDGSQIFLNTPSHVEFANNIVIGTDGHSALNAVFLGSNSNYSITDQYAIFDHNDIFNPLGPAFNGNGGLADPTGSYGNISADPLFVDAANHDYHLQAGSPAIDAGNNSALQQLDNQGSPLTKDFDGNPRTVDATGENYPIVDMGPYEHAGAQQTGPTTLLLTPAWYKPFAGTKLPLTAQLISPDGTPTGTVSFYLNGTLFGAALIDSTGKASISTPALTTVGQNTLLATYPGQDAFTPAVSVPVMILVQPPNATMALTSTSNPSAQGLPVSFTATLTATSNGTPTGDDVQFTANGNVLGAATLEAVGAVTTKGGGAGAATYTTSSLTTGTYTIVATYPGGMNWSGATASLTQVVKNPPVTETLTSSLNPSLRNQTVTLTATVSSTYGTPTGTIVFSDGSTALGTVPLTNGVATFTTSTLAIGTHTITAAYSGDDSFLNNSSSLIQTVNGISTTTVAAVTPSKLYALERATLTATVSGAGGTPTGTVTFSVGGTAIGTAALSASGTATLSYTFPASGNQLVTATYNPNTDPNYAASTSAAVAVNVLINDTATALNVTPSSVQVYHTVSLTATVTSASASAFGVTPSGTVNFLDGGTLLGSASLNATGVATLPYSFSLEGTHNLVAVYAGTTAFQTSQSSTLLTVVQPSPTVTAVTSNANPQELGAQVTLTATVSSGSTATQAPSGTVTFYDGSNALGAYPLDSTGKTSFSISTLTLGAHAITASYSSSTIHFLSSVSPAVTENIVVFSTATAVSANINPQEMGNAVTFTAKVAVSPAIAGITPSAPSGSVTFYVGSNSLGTATLDATGTASLTTSSLALGQSSITASYTSSSVDYLASVSPAFVETIVANLGDFTISVSPTAQTLYTGEDTQSIAVTLAPSSGWDRNVTLSCSQLPANTMCVFSKTAITGANGSSQLIIQTTAPHQAAVTAFHRRIPQMNGRQKSTALVALLLLPLGFGFRRRTAQARRSWLRRILPLVLFAALSAAMSGCGAPTETGGTPLGVYTVSVDATFSGYGVTTTRSAPFTLTVKSLF